MLRALATTALCAAGVTAATLAAGVVAPVLAQPPPSVTINGTAAVVQPPPLVRTGRVYVPLRGIFEQLGASVVYEGGTINATQRQRTVSLRVGSLNATIEGVGHQLDAPPFIANANAYVPLRFVSQALGAVVDYDGANRVVQLTTLPAKVNESTVMSIVAAVLDWVGPLCFGVVVGWITYRTLRRAPTNGISDLASVIGAIGGAGITALFTRDHGDFSRYCVGLIIGFFSYLWVAMRITHSNVDAWLGHDRVSSGAVDHGPVFPKPE
jgi:hypothetical protein